MALLNFPSNPGSGETYTNSGNTWQWNGTSWIAYNNLNLSSQVTGVLATLYGGTGKALSGLTVGSVLYADTSSSFAALGPSTADYVLATQGNGLPPYWKIDNSGTGSVGNGTTAGFAYYTGLNTITSGSGYSWISGSGIAGTVVLTNSFMALIGSTITSGNWAGSAITLAYGGTNNNISGVGHSYRVAMYDFAGAAITNITSGTANSILFQSNQSVSPAWVAQSTLVVGGATTAGISTNIGMGGVGSIPYNTAVSTTSFLNHSGAGNSVLITSGATGIAWTSQASMSVGTATNATNLNLAQASGGLGISYLVFAGGQSGVQPTYTATGITISAVSSSLYASNLIATGSNVSISPTTGSLVVYGGVGIGGSLITASGSTATVSGVSLYSGSVTGGTWAGTAITLYFGGTNGTNSGTALSYQLAVYNATGTAITQIVTSSSTGNSVLFQSAQNAYPNWVNQSSLSVGSATNATNATNTAITDDTSTSSAQYITWVGGTSGNQAQKITSSRLTFVPSTGVLTASSFSGSGANLTGIVNSLSANNGIVVSGSTGNVSVSNIGVLSLQGTANQVLVNSTSGSATTGAITLTLPQSINTTSSPSFVDITLSTGTNSTLANVGSQGTSLVNKQYVDNLASGLDIHGSVRAVLTSAIGGSYVQNQAVGSSAVGASIIAAVNGALPTIDGVSFVATGTTQRILIAGGATGRTNINASATWGTPTNTNLANGIYYVFDLGSAGSKWILVRATDTDDNVKLTGGTFTFVEEGTTYADTGWVCSNDTTNYGPIQFGLDNANTGAINFTQFSGAAVFTNGQGISKIGTTFATNFNITSFGPLTGGVGYTSFAIGGAQVGIAGTASNTTLRVGSATTWGSGTAAITLNTSGFSMSGGTNSPQTLTITGNISLPNPGTQYAIAYASDSNTVGFTGVAAGGGASVLTQTNGNAPVYLPQSQLSVGTATNLNLAQASGGLGISYLVFAGGQSGSQPTYTATGITISAASSALYATNLIATGSNVSISPTTGSLVVYGGVGIGGSLITASGSTATVSGVSLYSGSVTGGTWAGTAITLYFGGTNGSNSGTALSYQLAVYNATGTAITQIVTTSSTGNSVLIQSAQNAFPSWVAQSSLSVGSATNATNATNLNLASATGGLGISYLVFAGGQSGNQPTYTATGITISAASSALYATNLIATGSNVSISPTTGSLVVYGGVGIGGSLITASGSTATVSGVSLYSGSVTSGTWAGNAVTLSYGGTNNTIAGNGWSSKLAVFNATGLAITALTHNQGEIIIGSTGGTYAGLAATLIPAVSISGNPPARPAGAIGNTQAGQLWWDSTYGVLKVYYNDGDTSQWVDATPVLGSSGGGSSSKRSYVMTFGAGFTPTVGADSVQIQVPYAPDNTSKYYFIKRLDYRNETVSGSTGASFYIERFTGGNAAFSVSTGNRIHTVGAGAASSFVIGASTYTASWTLAASGASFYSSSGVAASIISGDYLRLNFTTVNSAATLSVSMVIEEQ